MLLITNIFLNHDFDFDNPSAAVARHLDIKKSDIAAAFLFRRSIDARKKNNVRFCCSFKAELNINEDEFLKTSAVTGVSKCDSNDYEFCREPIETQEKIVIAGFGPAGMFAALTLARRGVCPIVIERGEDVDSRIKSVSVFQNGGILNANSNIQFGEGGAGTFSDGKLNTGIKDPRCRAVLKEFASHGASSDILVNAKPHIGTDVLPKVVKNIRKEIVRLGGKVLFNTCLNGINVQNGVVKSIAALQNGNSITIPCDKLLLCLGHSARDTFELLLENGIEMQQKPFAVGARIEHPQKLIDRAQLGDGADFLEFIPADYKLSAHLKNGRGVYTFCMCPGGSVVNASSERGGICTNGMSNFLRNGKNANSALLVGVEPSDFPSSHPLAGVEFQRKIERRAFEIAGGYSAPSQTVGDFLKHRPSSGHSGVLPTIQPAPHYCSIDDCLPSFITDSMREGIKLFSKRLHGFDDSGALLTAPETRSSSPVRILRNAVREANITGIFPCGEGAGYAGGITSAAVDGIRTAEAVAERII